MDTDTRTPQDSRWADVCDVLEALAETHGTACVDEHAEMICRAHANILADSDTREEFEIRFGDYMYELVGGSPE